MANDPVGGVQKSTFRILSRGLKNPAMSNAVRVQLKLRKDQIDDEISVADYNRAVQALTEEPKVPQAAPASKPAPAVTEE